MTVAEIHASDVNFSSQNHETHSFILQVYNKLKFAGDETANSRNQMKALSRLSYTLPTPTSRHKKNFQIGKYPNVTNRPDKRPDDFQVCQWREPQSRLSTDTH
jgi:hypothetical protein